MATGAHERQAGCVVEHRVTVFGGPLCLIGREAEVGLCDIAFEDDRALEGAAFQLFPVSDGRLNAGAGGLLPGPPDEDSQRNACREQVAHQVASEEAGRARQQQVSHRS
jgi:hypothetical protein